MELVALLRELSRLRLALVFGVVLAALVAASTMYRLPSMQPRSLTMGAASTQILVESTKPSLASINQDMTPLVMRAAVYARFMTSEPVKAAIAKAAGVPTTKITVDAPLDPTGPEGSIQPPSERRADQLVVEGLQYRLFIQNQQALPILDVYAQGPDAESAMKLADAAAVGLRESLTGLENQGEVAATHRIRVIQLGQAEGGPVAQSGSKVLAVLAFAVVFTLYCIVLLFLSRLARDWRAAQSAERLRAVQASERMRWRDEADVA